MFINKPHGTTLIKIEIGTCLFFETGVLCVALAILQLENPPASAPQALELEACPRPRGCVNF